MKYICLHCNEIFTSNKTTIERECPHCKTVGDHQMMSLNELSDFGSVHVKEE